MDSERRVRFGRCRTVSDIGSDICRPHDSGPILFVGSVLIHERDHPPLPPERDAAAVRELAGWQKNREGSPEMLLMIVEGSSGDASAVGIDAQPQLVLEGEHLLHQQSPPRFAGEEWIGGDFDVPVEGELFHPRRDTVHQIAPQSFYERGIPYCDYLPHGERGKSLGGMARARVVFVPEAAAESGDYRRAAVERAVRNAGIVVVADGGRPSGFVAWVTGPNELLGKCSGESRAAKRRERDLRGERFLDGAELERPTAHDAVEVFAQGSRRAAHGK